MASTTTVDRAVLDKPLAAVPARVSGLDAMVETKLWRNPCWFTFRLNYLALSYNVPLYSWVEGRYGLSRPEYVVVFSLGLHGDALARDIASSSGFPKNTLSRAIHKLTQAGLVERRTDPADKRGRRLRLSAEGRRVFEESLPAFVSFERMMLQSLTDEECDTLSRLMAKMVLDSVHWPKELDDDRPAAAGDGRRQSAPARRPRT